MSFSKTSIFCLILLMVFIAAPVVMAHDASIIGDLGAHKHPTLGLDQDGDGDFTDPGDYPAHNHHPVVSITLEPVSGKVYDDHVLITEDDDGTPNSPDPAANPPVPVGNNQFYLVVSFTGAASGQSIAANEIDAAILNANGIKIENNNAAPIQITSSTVDPDDATKYRVLVTIDTDSDLSNTADTNDAIPTGVAGALEKLTARIQVQANAVLGAVGQVKVPNQVDPQEAPAIFSAATKVYEFVLVHALPETDAPTLAITHDPLDGTKVGTDGMVTFTFTFTDASGIATKGAGAFTTDDITVSTGGTKGDFTESSNLVYTLKVTPTTPYTDVTVTVAADSVTDTSVFSNALAAAVSETYTAPTAPPVTLTVSHSPKDNVALPASGKVTFTFTASVELEDDADEVGAFTLSDITFTGGKVAATDDLVQDTTDTKVYTVDVTPDAATSGLIPYENVSVTVAAGAVTDIYGNPSTAVATETWRAPDTFLPTLTITHSPADGAPLPVGNVVDFSFKFSEPLGSGDADFTASDLQITNGDVVGVVRSKANTDNSGKSYMVAVKVRNPDEHVTVTVAKTAVADTSSVVGGPNNLAKDVSETYDSIAPTLTVTHKAAAGKVTFWFEASERLSTSAPGALTKDDITVTGGTPGDFQPATGYAGDPNPDLTERSYWLEVTPNATATMVTVAVAAGAVTDMSGNASTTAATGDLTWKAPAAPTVTITSDPASGDELPTSGMVTFTFEFSEALGSGDASFQLLDVEVTGGAKQGFTKHATKANTWEVVVTPTDPTTDVTVAVKGAVLDTDNNGLDTANSTPAGATFTYVHHDRIAPTVVISALQDKDSQGNITFIFDFNEPIVGFTADDVDRSGASDVANVVEDVTEYTGTATNPLEDAYTIKIEPTNKTGKVNIQIRKGSVTDLAGNGLARDYSGTWSPTSAPPDEKEAPVVKSITIGSQNTQAPMLLDTVNKSENVITVVIEDNKGLSTTDKLASGDIVVTGGSASNFTLTETSTTMHTATFNVMPNDTVQSVTIKVNAGAVSDTASPANKNAAKSETFAVAPLISVPAGQFVIIARYRHRDYTVLSDQPSLPHYGSANLAPNIGVQTWEHMPDLRTHFAISNPGTGSGALFLKKAPGSTANVVISEIMWAIDDVTFGNAANDWQTRHQWIELHNVGSTDAKVHIYARSALELKNNGNAAEVRSPHGDVVDVVSNYYNGSIGVPRWQVPGQNGNSETGVNFVSMMRTKHNNAYKDGKSSGSWTKSTNNYYTATTSHTDQNRKIYHHVGTPGRPNTFTNTVQPYIKNWTSPLPSSPVIFNEIANRSNADSAYEWIELRNVTNSRQNIREYRISMVTGVGTDTLLCEFDGDNWIEPNSVLLLLASDPYNDPNHPISVGWNVDLPVQVRGVNENSPKYKVITFRNGGLPDNGEFVLFLRSPDNAAKNDPAELGAGEYNKDAAPPAGSPDNNDANKWKRGGLDKVVDIAGYHPNLTSNPYNNPVSKTDFWPLTAFGRHSFSNNKIEVNKVHYRRHVTTNKGAAGGAGAWDNNNGKTALTDAGFTGLGYRRGVLRSNVLGGDPGYHGILKNQVGQLTTGEVVISEIMLSQGPANAPANRKLPQWLELHNTSKTEAVNLAADAGWRLIIEMPSTDATIGAFKTINFKTKGNVKVIEPNESILVVSGRARSYGSSTHLRSSVIFPTTRVYNVWQEQRADFDMRNNQLAPILPLEGFHIKLVDGKGTLSDEIGNIDGHNRTSWYRDIPQWSYPNSLTKDDGYRSSLIRIYDNGMPRNGVSMEKSNVIPLGEPSGKFKDMNYAWIHAADTGTSPFYAITHQTWWGAETDHGTPIQRANAPLPVELSAFQPTLEDGKVVVRWTTESEKDNAGFNIYRSETRGGEFKQVNAQLVEGAGTTGERNTYEWVDTTAKPDVVYYYQIEDVSFSGERQTLAESRLRGYVSAKNKLTTRWGELKKTLQ